MEIYKGIATFSGIAIGKILYYSRGEYQIRQCLVSNIKKEIEDFRKAKEQAVAKLKELYEANKSLNEQEARTFLNQAKLLESELARMRSRAALPTKRSMLLMQL